LKRVHTVIRSVAALALIASVSCGGAIAQQQPTHLPVPATAIYPGDVIREEMIIDRTFAPNMPGVAAFFAERTLVVGQIATNADPGPTDPDQRDRGAEGRDPR
jgi:flagella basal body P-ring formation protein FlgA